MQNMVILRCGRTTRGLQFQTYSFVYFLVWRQTGSG